MVLYLVYWRFWHPDRIGGKVPWKRAQAEVFDHYTRPVLDKNDPEHDKKAFDQFRKQKSIVDYDLKQFGVGLYIKCDYKDKDKDLSPEQRAEKKEMKKAIKKAKKDQEGCLSSCFKRVVYDKVDLNQQN